MKNLFIIAAFAGLMACNTNEPKIVIEGTQIDFTEDRFVSDSVFMNNQAYIDSISQLESVNELLDYLETVPVQ